MATLWLSPDHVETMIHHSQANAPNEACGLILGDSNKVSEIVPTRNMATDPTRRFHLDNEALVKHHKRMMGIYHSHPNSDPIPSTIDIQESCYPDDVYVIIGLNKTEPRLMAWRIRYGRVDAVTIHIGNHPPHEEEPPLSKAQKTAMIIAALVVVMMMLVMSFSLLPPAPPIP